MTTPCCSPTRSTPGAAATAWTSFPNAISATTPIPFKEVAGTGKAQVTFDFVPVDKATAYAAEDADVTLRLWKILKPRLAADGMTNVYERLERPMVPVLARMEREGIMVDRQVLSRLSGDFAQAMAASRGGDPRTGGRDLQHRLAQAARRDPVRQDERLPAARRPRPAPGAPAPACSKGSRPKAMTCRPSVLDWRQMSKLKSTYTDALPEFINPETGRVHTSYALASTSTGRLSSTEPNLQNIPVRTEGRPQDPHRLRRAGKGAKLVSADYSQIELRVLAHIADIASLRQAFADGLDIHAMTASEMFGVPVEGMDPMVRRRAKAINFGIIYGISAFGLANQLQIGRAARPRTISTPISSASRASATTWSSTKETCRKQGYVETIFGRRAHYPEINSKNPNQRAFMERAAINAPIQGSAADIIRRAMMRMHKALDDAGLKARMLLQVHDELIFEAEEAEIEKTIAVASEVMEKAPEPVLKLAVPLKVDARAADNWEEAH